MNTTHLLRGAFAAVFCLPFLLPVVAACGPGLPPPSSGGSCQGLACPAGAYDVCEPVDTRTSCCNGSASFQACALPAGVLSHTCPATCASNLCAISKSGAVTCCDFGASSNPCNTSVP